MDKLWDMNELLKNYKVLKLWGVRFLIRQRAIPMVKIGRRIYFVPEDIEAWIKQHKVPVQKRGGN